MLVRNFYIKDILNIAFPIMLGNLGFILIGVGDVIVAGRHSTETLASVSVATAIINCIVMIGIGILSSLSAILSNYRGAGKDAEKYFYPALKFTTIASIVISLAVMAFIPVIDKLGFEPHLAQLVKDYFWIISFSIFGAYLHCMSKEYLQAFEIVVFPNILTVFCIFVNLFLNIIFAFGYGPIPEMGTKGLALSTLITRYLMGGILFWYCFHKTKIQHFKDKEFYRDLLKVILGRISGIYAAAQNIVCTLTTVSFMIPFAISNATAVKVGFANGAKYYKSLKTYAFTGITMAVVFMACSAVVVGTFPKLLVSLFTKDQELINVCIPIVFALCFFQVFDGLQVALAGIFRGLKQTGIVMISNFIGYWLVSIPLGCLLAFKYKMDLLGFWYGLVCAAIVLCSIMFTTMLIKFKKMN